MCYCGREFPNVEYLQIHEQDFHTEYKCKNGECEYTALGMKDMKYHTKSLHKDWVKPMPYMWGIRFTQAKYRRSSMIKYQCVYKTQLTDSVLV